MSDNKATINWYPGHMTKAKRMMQENISLIDLIIEIVDARIPLSSRNPDIDELGKNKSRVILLNKSDLADARHNELWMEYFKEKGFHVVLVNSKNGQGIKSIQSIAQEACKEKIERDRKRGIINRPVRAMVVGIPNVGKSTFINAFAGKACTKTGNKPGVTKGKQWIRMNKQLELLDTPGILWPKFEDAMIGQRLAFIGSINDEILHIDELAVELIKFLGEHYKEAFLSRYQIEWDADPYVVLENLCLKRGCIAKGEKADILKGANLLLDEFRAGKIGRISLEFASEEAEETLKE